MNSVNNLPSIQKQFLEELEALAKKYRRYGIVIDFPNGMAPSAHGIEVRIYLSNWV